MKDPILISLEEVESDTRTAIDAAAEHADELDADLGLPLEEIAIFSKDMPPGGRLLDVGCGSARYAMEFVKRGWTYCGIDLSPKMLQVARHKNPTLRFEEMSFRKLNFPDASFEALWSCCSFTHEPKRNMHAVLTELRRVLVPGGIFHTILPYTDWGQELIAPYHYKIGTEGYYASWEEGEFCKALERAGFVVLDSMSKPHDGTSLYFARK